ncbi:hypothetical protein [Mucilaginibacter koreensis]
MKTYKLLLAIAAILFIAKPFVGFSVYDRLGDGAQENSLMAKVFAKRKPEFLEEATAKSISIRAQLRDKAKQFTFSFQALLIYLFPLLFVLNGNRFRRHYQQWQTCVHTRPLYLLTRQLTI